MTCSELPSILLLLSLSVSLAVGAAVREDTMEVFEVDAGNSSILPCTAKYKPGVQYLAVRWYKVDTSSSSLSGLLTRDLPNGNTSWYSDMNRDVELQAESRNIILPNVTCNDSGMYRCRLAAPVGEQNQDGHVLLMVTGCPAVTTENKMADAYSVIFASVLLMLALVILVLSYYSSKNVVKERNKKTKKEILLDAPCKPLEKKDMKLIYTLGSKSSTLEHICV